jgi:hypothetical protein
VISLNALIISTFQPTASRIYLTSYILFAAGFHVVVGGYLTLHTLVLSIFVGGDLQYHGVVGQPVEFQSSFDGAIS